MDNPPAQETTALSVNDGLDVGVVFLWPTKVNNSIAERLGFIRVAPPTHFTQVALAADLGQTRFDLTFAALTMWTGYHSPIISCP
jgi:hypothetical protein